ncbi:MAG: sigma factor [Acidimicrobiales bacterium]|nr:sigma factor [Acidimicrobiales bacterium]
MQLPPFQHLLDSHGVALHRFCVAQAGPDHGPDCFQEAIIAALRAYPGLRDASNLRGWLFTIAHTRCSTTTAPPPAVPPRATSPQPVSPPAA